MEKTWAPPTWKTPPAFPTFPQLRRRDRFTELPMRTKGAGQRAEQNHVKAQWRRYFAIAIPTKRTTTAVENSPDSKISTRARKRPGMRLPIFDRRPLEHFHSCCAPYPQ